MTLRTPLACTFLAAALLLASGAHAQIGRPGAHEKYATELEPHLVLQHSDSPFWGDDGIGLGLRASFPVIQDGPVRTINNSFAIGVGFDWAHFDDSCGNFDCDANDFWVPVVVQWNFFFSDLISAFPEVGLAVEYSRWDGDWDGVCFNRGNARFCANDYDDGDGDIDIELVLWLGVRFHLARSFALTLRLGTPSILLGASFFM
jgi:hypothetical protein